MKQICISDITMRQATSAFSLSFKEKIELAKLLDRLGVSVIELEGVSNARVDALRIKSIATSVNDSIVAVPVSLDGENILQVFSALSQAKHPRLQVCAAVSPVQMEYIHHKKQDAMLTAISDAIAECRKHCKDVEFIADDATRSEPEFLSKALELAISQGATTVTLNDTAGTMLPDEFAAFIRQTYQNVPSLKSITLGVSCSNELAMADASLVAAICEGACEVKTAAYPVNTASLSNISRILSSRGDQLEANCAVNVTQLSRVMKQILWMCQTERSKTSPFDNGVQEEDATAHLTVRDDMDTVLKAVERMGYDLSEEDGIKVFDAFQSITKKKEKVSTRELDAIVASAAMQVPATYVLDTYVITSGNTVSSTAHLKLTKAGAYLEGVSIGDGPIDAAFLAIESITGHHYELDDFQIQSVTEGREAMGQTIVKLRSNGKVYSGRGISTDIVGASIYAYISALNKIVYEEEDV